MVVGEGGATADLLHQEDQLDHLHHYHPLHTEMQAIDMVVAMACTEEIDTVVVEDMIDMEEEGDPHQEEEICIEIKEV